jgi:hypothetical protein
MNLPLHPLAEYTTAHGASMVEKFHAFHEANPHVLVALIKLALDVQEMGRGSWSINGAFEVLRWSALKSIGDDYKLNNNFRAMYSRLIPFVEPALKDFFDIREQRGEPFYPYSLAIQIKRLGGWRVLIPKE